MRLKWGDLLEYCREGTENRAYICIYSKLFRLWKEMKERKCVLTVGTEVLKGQDYKIG
jgi:hypothetical protein